MSLTKISKELLGNLEEIQKKGAMKGDEKVITGILTGVDGYGPRYTLSGYPGRHFLCMNSNSYFGLALNEQVIAAEAKAAEHYGAGPGAVRFISGTYQPHVELEQKLADFHGRESAMITSAAYATVMGVLPQFINSETLVVSDALNHNSIINAIRLSRPAKKMVYPHLDIEILNKVLESGKGRAKRVCVVTDGIFSMRGDHAPLDQIYTTCRQHEDDYEQGIITVVDDSHGVGVFGRMGRGTEEFTQSKADILIGTLGKAFGVNGGYVTSNNIVIDYLRETSPLYIYSNPITPAEAAAALQSLEIIDSSHGLQLLEKVRRQSALTRAGLKNLNFEILTGGGHPIVPIFIRDTEKTTAIVRYLFDHNILVTGLNYPVVPKGEEEIRVQVSALHTDLDIEYFLTMLDDYRSGAGK